MYLLRDRKKRVSQTGRNRADYDPYVQYSNNIWISFFFFFCLFALPQLLRTRISYTTAFQGEELLKKGEMLLCCGTSEQWDAYAEEKT